jgi:hypothetical protein
MGLRLQWRHRKSSCAPGGIALEYDPMEPEKQSPDVERAAVRAERDEYWPCLEQLVKARGYLVWGRNSRERIGRICPGKRGQQRPQPFRIISETTLEDWLAQAELLTELLGVESAARAGVPYTYFYRLVTE